MPSRDSLADLASALSLGALLERLRADHGGYDLLAHWTQGEFHHDVVLRAHDAAKLPGPILVVATNCNGGVKEVLCLAEVPERYGLWHWRCPKVADFSGAMPELLGRATTEHFFDPCELLADDARSELRPEWREREPGGGWRCRV